MYSKKLFQVVRLFVVESLLIVKKKIDFLDVIIFICCYIKVSHYFFSPKGKRKSM